MVAFWIIFFTAARASTMDFLLKPLGQWAGVKNRSDQVRFAEQGWLLLYYCVFYTLGMVCGSKLVVKV
jgi:acyl-CoA-dependent ceramide synthase